MAFPHKENGPVVLRFSEWAAEAVPALILTSFGHGFSWSPQRITSQNQQEASSYGYSAKQAVKHQVGPLRRNLRDRKFMALLILKAFTWWTFEISERILRKHSERSWWFMGLRWQLWQVNQTCRHLTFMMTTRPPTAETAVADGCRQTDKSAVWLLLWIICCQEWGEKKRPYFWPATFFMRLHYGSEMINRE